MLKNGGIQQELSRGGTLQKYRSTVTGNQGIKAFLLYEFFATLLCPLPGVPGILIRRLYSPLLFTHCGHDITMMRDLGFRRPHQIHIGNGVTLEHGVTLDVKGDGGSIEIQDNVHIGSNTILSCPGGALVVGKGTSIGKNCRLGSLKGLTIGQHSRIDDYTCLVGAGHAHNTPTVPIIKQPLTCKGPTTIGDHVEIGREVTILDGIHIGRNVTIVARSFVNKDIASNCTASGVPALPKAR